MGGRMAIEIERKFRVLSDAWRRDAVSVRHLRQAYLTKNGRISIRVRIDGDASATLTIKTAAAGIERNEYEYPIPVADARELLERREGSIIVKRRHIVPVDGHEWEIDVFEGDNAGLIVAEIELPRAGIRLVRPPWLGAEITHDRRYYNADLARHPYALWQRTDVLAAAPDPAPPRL
jgi:adenylate cyclase